MLSQELGLTTFGGGQLAFCRESEGSKITRTKILISHRKRLASSHIQPPQTLLSAILSILTSCFLVLLLILWEILAKIWPDLTGKVLLLFELCSPILSCLKESI